MEKISRNQIKKKKGKKIIEKNEKRQIMNGQVI